MERFASIQMSNGSILSGQKIGELAEFIISKFADEDLSHDEAVEVLKGVKDVLGEYSKVIRSD